MIKPITILISVTLLLSNLNAQHVRYPSDTIGYPHTALQMDSLASLFEMESFLLKPPRPYKAIICPHDDYIYAAEQYLAAFKHLRAKTILIFGVAHKARLFGMEDKIIFDSFSQWQGPYSKVKVSNFREKMQILLPDDAYTVSDSMHNMEHSIEALIPFIQYFVPDAEIIPVLIPYMDFKTMDSLSEFVSNALFAFYEHLQQPFGSDIAILISNDAVHYGNKGWGGKDYATYGVDSTGYKMAIRHDHNIIDSSLTGFITSEKIEKFCRYTVEENDHKEYKWTWCGRYSVPFGLLAANKFNKRIHNRPLRGKLLEYSTSIEPGRTKITVPGLGTTAPASLRHWVGYAAVGFW